MDFTAVTDHAEFFGEFPVCTIPGYDGFEFHPTEPDDDRTWSEMASAFKASGLKRAGMYVVSKGIADEDCPTFDAEVSRARRMIDRLALIDSQAFVNFTIMSNPVGRSTPDYRDAGSSRAEARHWERTARMVKAVDDHLALRGLSGNFYNHIWFMIDTPAAQLRAIQDSGAKVIRPGIALFHSHFHPGVPDLHEVMAQPGMERLGYFALLNGWPKPANSLMASIAPRQPTAPDTAPKTGNSRRHAGGVSG